MEFRPNMTEQELLTDLLNEEKHLVTQYASNITESACMNLRQLLMTNMSECSSDHYSVFDQIKIIFIQSVKRRSDKRALAYC